MISRQCSRTACKKAAVATLTYVHAEQTAVLGPLATYAEPHTYDLCAAHAAGLTAPRGWRVVRLDVDLTGPDPTSDDLLALADAVSGSATSQARASQARASQERPSRERAEQTPTGPSRRTRRTDAAPAPTRLSVVPRA